MNQFSRWIMLAACLACIDWTRFKGTVKAINLRANTVMIQNKDGDLLTIPVDYEVKIVDKDGTLRGLKDLVLDQKILLTRTPADMPVEDTTGMAQPEPSPRGK